MAAERRLGALSRHLTAAQRGGGPLASTVVSAGPADRRGWATDRSLEELGLASLSGTAIAPAEVPRWATLQRQLIATVDEAVPVLVRKFAERGGALYFAEDYDDLYEVCATWGLFYAIGGDESVLDLALQQWNASTRISDEGIRHRIKHNDLPGVKKKFSQSGYREYYGLSHPGDAEWHHKGEGNICLYDFGLCDPTITEQVRRTRQFAGYYIGEDPAAPNYDPTFSAGYGQPDRCAQEYKILRSPAQTGAGPWLHCEDVLRVHTLLMGSNALETHNYYGTRASLKPIVPDLEPDWWQDEERRVYIMELFNQVICQSDSANNLAACAMVTHAYLQTGDQKYKQWVLEYCDAWLKRIEANDGIVPDNVGPTGVVGERRGGQWWGGFYGWNCYSGHNIMMHSIGIGMECAHLLSGDPKCGPLL